jgi:hypothetical protein
MSQFNIRNIREISNDPLTKFTNQLAKKLSKFLVGQELDKLENKEDIYSDGQDIDSVVKFHTYSSQTKFDGITQYFPPFEPDGVYNTCWIKGRNLGNTTPDLSTFGNVGTIIGDPLLIDGTPFDYGIHTYGIKSLATRFNRPLSDLENSEYMYIPDATNMQVSGIATGISYFIRFRLKSLAQQASYNRNLFEKIDDNTPSNGVKVCVDSSGRLMVYIKRAGTEYNKQTATSTILVDTVYDVWITYAVSGNVVHVYVNNVDKSLTDPGSPTWHTTLTDHNMDIFRRGTGSDSGYVYGDFYDFELFREKVISAAEVGFHYTNKWTIADIAFGKVMVTNYWATYTEAGVPSTSFTSTSFTSGSFTA